MIIVTRNMGEEPKPGEHDGYVINTRCSRLEQIGRDMARRRTMKMVTIVMAAIDPNLVRYLVIKSQGLWIVSISTSESIQTI